MNPSHNRLERLLGAARDRTPIPEPSPWFEQRMISALRTEEGAFADSFALVFRFLAGAALLMALSVILASAQPRNPYLETMEMAGKTMQMEKIP